MPKRKPAMCGPGPAYARAAVQDAAASVGSYTTTHGAGYLNKSPKERNEILRKKLSKACDKAVGQADDTVGYDDNGVAVSFGTGGAGNNTLPPPTGYSQTPEDIQREQDFDKLKDD